MGLGGFLKGAIGGAMGGGSFGGPLGAAVGGVAGGLLGGFGGSDEQKRLEEYRKSVMGRPAPQLGPAAQASNSGFRANQQDLVSRLEALSRGEGPSLANEQLKMATDRNMAAQQSIAQSGRGNATLANIVAANQMGNLGQQAAQQSVIGRIGEQQMALGQLGQNIGAGRQADEATSQFNALAQNYNAKDNLEARLRSMGMGDQAILSILGQQANQVGIGDQLLAGGTGALGMWAGQRAQQGANQGGVSKLASQGRYLDSLYARA